MTRLHILLLTFLAALAAIVAFLAEPDIWSSLPFEGSPVTEQPIYATDVK